MLAKERPQHNPLKGFSFTSYKIQLRFCTLYFAIKYTRDCFPILETLTTEPEIPTHLEAREDKIGYTQQ